MKVDQKGYVRAWNVKTMSVCVCDMVTKVAASVLVWRGDQRLLEKVPKLLKTSFRSPVQDISVSPVSG